MVPPKHQSFGFPFLTIYTRWPGLHSNFLRQTDNGGRKRWMMDRWVDEWILLNNSHLAFLF